MASVKVKFRPSTVADREGAIFYQVIHERATKHILTDYHIFPDEWNAKTAKVIVGKRSNRQSVIFTIKELIKWDLERLHRLISGLEKKGNSYTTDDVIDEFKRYEQECSLFNFMELQIVKLKQKGKSRTAETYVSTLNSFKKFRNNEDIMMDALTSDIMEDYEAFLQKRGNIPNTISFYMRILRAVYNRAVEQELIEQRNPFRRVYTGVDKTQKRALPMSVIKKIHALDLGLNPALDYARDMFMMSFFLRGMSFIDMAFLRKTDLQNGSITYRRRKTNQKLTIGWTREMQTLLDKYPENPTQYILPIIQKEGIDERLRYRSAGYNINRSLKTIAKLVNVNIPLTLYCARHSWASAAKAKGIPLSVISEGMGHDSETTTQIYLASLETSVVDDANSLILSDL